MPLMRHEETAGAFPIEALGPLRAAAEAAQDMSQAPMALAAQSALAVASLATQALADVETLSGQATPLSIFALSIAKSGERKSTVDRRLMTPVREVEKALSKEHQDDTASWRNKLDIWAALRADILKKAKKGNVESAVDLEALGPEPEGPLMPQLVASEPTFEGITKHLRISRPSLGIFSDEGGGFIGGHAMSTDNKLKTMAGLSGMWDGSPVNRTRAGDGVSTFYGRRLCCHLMVQPIAAEGFLSDPIAMGQGFLARFLVVQPESAIGTRLRHGHDAASTATLEAWSGRVQSLLSSTKPDLAGCRVIIVTDRVDLEKQLAGTFVTGGAFGSDVATKKDGETAKVQSGRDLAKRIRSGTERIIFTLLQKFNSATKLPECHNPSDKIVVLIDEGHRSQGGENHERMRKALPNAAFIAFTGTPLLKEDKTRNKFGPILHAYTMQRAVEDGAVTPLVYEERKPIIDINDAAIDAWFDNITTGLTDTQKADLKQKYATRGQVYGAANRIELIAWDIATHFSENFGKLDLGLKAQLATDSKLSAIRYKKALDATGKVTSAVVISAPDTREGHEDADEANVPEVQAWWKANVGNDAKAYEDKVIEDFSTDGAPDILIVVDKLLTGFDEPRNAVLYIDKHLKGHNLLQAIARVNRLHEAKKHGFLIDYRSILAELDTSIRDYQDLADQTQGGYEIDDLAGTVSNVSTEYKRLPGLHDALWAIFADVKNKHDREQFRQVLVPRLRDDGDDAGIDDNQKVREDFYDALTAFGMCLHLALSSRAFFEDRGFSEATIQTYKRDLKFFTEIRIQAKRDANETVDFTVYEAQIRRLVDSQVIGQQIVDPEGVILVGGLGTSDDPDDWSDDKTRTEADLIKTRVRKTIEQDLIDDPHAQRVFSELLKEAIRAAEAMFDHPGMQYTLFKDLEAKVGGRATPGVPDRFSGHPMAQSFYGVFIETLGEARADEFATDDLVDEAHHIEQTVEDAIKTHSINPGSIEAEIRRALLPRYFKFLGGLDAANAVIDQVIGIVRAGAVKGQR